MDNIFRNNPAINGIPIVENNRPIGLIMRNKFYASLASQYGVVLYKGRPINLIMDPHPLVLDYYTPIDKASRVTVTRKDEQLYDYIIITKDDKYYGITTVKDLLVNTTQLELNIAKHSNPLTGLPGNLIIEEKFQFFSEQDINNGYIVTENRRGQVEQFPLVAISLAVITHKFKFEKITDLSEKASEIKHQCKLNNNSCYCIY